jgi:hypothetical protein
MAGGDPIPWTALPYNSPWGDYSAGGWQAGQYMKDAAGWVNVRGLVVCRGSYGYAATSAIICYLPVGYRTPYSYEMFNNIGMDSASSEFVARIDHYNSDGRLFLVGGVGGNNGGQGWFNLSSIRFFAGF